MIDIWQGDIEEGDFAVHMKDGVDAVYTDPPWNAGMAKLMRGWAGLEGDYTYDGLVRDAVYQINEVCPDGPWFVECGAVPNIWLNEVKRYREGVHSREGTWGMSVRRKMHVIQSNVDPLMPLGLHGEQVTEWAFNYFADTGIRSVCDPFVGHGTTAKYAVNRGLDFYGMDFNIKRVEFTLALVGALAHAED